MRLSRVVLAALIVVLAALAFLYRRPIWLFGLVLTGNSPVCTLQRAVAADRHAAKLQETHNWLVSETKKVASDDRFEQWATPRGAFWMPVGSRFVLPFNLAEQELKIYGEGPQAVRKGDIVLDCGANVGVFTRAALRSGAAKVIAIEPAPENIEALRRNFKAEEAAGTVIVYPKGVWDKDDMLSLHVDPHNSAADSVVLHADKEGGVRVPLTTIDKIVAELKLPRVDFIKMDIEGAEPNALRGARATIAEWKPRISVSVYHAPDHPVTLPKIIREARADYDMECGPCTEVNGHIRPDILYFR